MAVARIALEKRLAAEKEPLVRQDLEILIAEADRNIRSSEARERNLLPYEDVAGTIFFGMKSLLDDQVTADRRPAAVVRLRKYVGLESGYEPLSAQAEERFREKSQTSGLLGPAKVEVEKNLENTQAYITGIGLLLEKYKLAGYQDAFRQAQGAACGLRRFRPQRSAAKSSHRFPPPARVVHHFACELRYRLYAR